MLKNSYDKIQTDIDVFSTPEWVRVPKFATIKNTPSEHFEKVT